MVHKQKREYVVTAIAGTKWSPEIAMTWVKKSQVQSTISEMKKLPDVHQIGVQKGDIVEFLRGFTPMGELSVIKRIRALPSDSKIRIVKMSTPTSMFGVSKVVK